MASTRGNLEQQNNDFVSNPAFLPPSKLISLQRQSNGFGFTLRHFVVYPPELIRKSSEPGSKPGVNGLDHHVDDIERQKSEPMDTVFVRQVAPSGPADRAGLSTGDQIVSVNGHPVLGKSYSQVIELIVASHELLELGIIPKEDCVLQMVTPSLAVPPKISVSSNDLSQSPPPVKPKPAYRRRSSGESPSRVMSTITISPANSYHLKMSDKTSQSATALGGGDSEAPIVTLRRGSVDRTAMENRSYVITSDSMDYNSNLKSRSSSALESASNYPRMEGSYFMAATDSSGRPLALRFEKGSKVGNTLTVLEDSRKMRSHSLPVVELQGLGEQSRASHDISDSSKAKSVNVADAYGSENDDRSSVNIPPFMLSSPRTVASDSPSTTYLNTDADNGSRQPIATDPGYKKSRSSPEETSSKSYLIRTIASRMHKDRQEGLKSSTMGTTLLESKDVHPHWQSGGPGRWVPTDSSSEMQKDSDTPHPAKVPRQSDDQAKQDRYSSQVSVNPNKPFEELSFTPIIGSSSSEAENSQANKQGSPKPRRVSYLMATSRGMPHSSDQKIWATSPQGKKPGKSSVFQALSTMLPPVMVHVSSGMELCEDVNGEEGMEIAVDEHEDEVFSGTTEGKVSSEGTTIQRTNRRTSYVMATSSPTSRTHQLSLEVTKEEEETKGDDSVSSMMEVCKEGLLWRKLAVVDGGKRSSARSWKPVFAVLRGHVLYLYKDKSSAHQEDGSDEQPISIKSSIVDIAHDYTKRKNVFRLTTFNGSEFLFQAEDHDSMMLWISAIQANNNPDEDENGVSSQSLIIRRMKTVEQETSGSSASTPTHKLSPPINTKIPSIPGISNIKKSLSFKNITTGQKGESGKSQSHKSTKKRKQTKHPNSYPSGHSIGVPLELCPPSKSNKMIPLVVEHSVEVVERKGLETVGVYRVPGNSAAVTALQEELNNRGIENVCLQDEKWNDVNNITSLLKLFLRKLPEGLVTADLYDGLIESNKKEDAAERMWSIRSVVQELPDHNFETLKFLVNHLKMVSDNCDKNKMEVRNLAIVFGPTIIRTGDDSMMAMVKDMSDQCRIVETLITECDWFFEEVEGDECPIQALPSSNESPQEHILSQNVLCSLGQVAVNFGDDGSYKPKSSGISLHIPKFRSSKSSKSDSGQGSSSDGPLSDSQGSEGSPPPVRSVSGEGSRSNSPTLDRSTRFGSKKIADSSSASIQLVLDSSDAEFRFKGAGSLKAYSYSHPPPPSYRRVIPQKRSTSPGTPEQPLAPLEVNSAIGQHDLEARKPLDESRGDLDTNPKPSFSSFSEETRRRLLRLNLQKKAEEKRRQSEGGDKEPSSPPLERSDETIRDFPRDFQRKLSDQENFEITEQPSSSSTSRSSSAHSSKNPSLDSLHVASQPDKMAGGAVVFHGEPPRVSSTLKTTSLPSDMPQEAKPRSGETVVAVIKGRGVVSGTVRLFDATRRPASLDIPSKRESVEDLRLARRSVGSEESSDTSSDEGDECAISMSKTFDEKLKILLDLGNTFGGKGSEMVGQSDDDRSSVRSEPPNRQVVSRDEMAQRRSSDEPAGRIYKIVGMSPSKDSYETVSLASSGGSVFKDDTRPDNPEIELRSSSSVEFNASKYFASPSTEDHAGSSHPFSPLRKGSVGEGTLELSGSRNVGALRQKFESSPGRARGRGSSVSSHAGHISAHDLQGRMSPQTVQHGNQGRSPAQDTHGRKGSGQDSVLQQGAQGRGRDHVSSVTRKKIGSVRTTTPVSLKEFSIRPSSVKTQAGQSGLRSEERGNAQRPPESKTSASRSIRLESSPAKHSSATPSRYSTDRSDVGVDRNTRSRLNTGLTASDRSKGQPFVGRTHVAPRVMGREYGTKSKLLSHKDSAKELLPSKTRIPPKDARGSQTQRKLEKDAQHIAELLEEMHSERHLHLSRQQSDISGQAQRAAAQRAAMRRRRRSLGDENDADASSQSPNSPLEERHDTQGVYNARSNGGYYTVTR